MKIRSKRVRKGADDAGGMTQEQLEDLMERITTLQDNVNSLAGKISRYEDSVRAAVNARAAAASPRPRIA